MGVKLAFIVPLALLLTGATDPGDAPACVTAFIEGEAGTAPVMPAPTVSPAAGDAGTMVTVTGSAASPGASITLIALYGENDCAIRGLGDQLLGTARADAEGRYRLERPWPATFTPLLGREDVGTVALPAGRYYILALGCADAGACGRAGTSAAGGPYRAIDDARGIDPTPAAADTHQTPMLVLAGVAVLSAGIITLRRIVRAR